MKSALLVIDVQQGLCSGEHRTHEAEAVIERINRAADKTRAVGMPVFWIQHEAPEGLFCHGSPSWQLARGLDARPGDQYLRKTTGDRSIVDISSIYGIVGPAEPWVDPPGD